MRARRRAAASLVLVSIGVLAGCAPSASAGWTPPAWSASEVRVAEALPAPLDPAGLPQLTLQRLRNEAVGVQARLAYLPGAQGPVAAFNARIDEMVRAAISQRGAEGGVAYRPAVGPRDAGLAARGCVPGSTSLPAAEVLGDPALAPSSGSGVAIVCDVVAAQGEIFGERLRVVVGSSSEVASDTSVVIYVDTATGELATAEQLWTAEAAAILRADIVEAIRREAGGLSLVPLGPPDEEQERIIRLGLTTTVPARDGALAFTLPAGFQAAELTDLGIEATQEPLTIEVPSQLVVRVATPFGARLSEASGADFLGPSAVPAGREWVDCRLVPCLALTYDDGPSSLTPILLDHLVDARAAATFYVLGRYASRNPETIERAAREGHELGGHTWSHPDLTRLTDEEIRSQLDRTQGLLQRLSGQPVTTFRPPYGSFDRRVLAAADRPAIIWTVDTRDWAGPSDEVLRQRAIDEPRPGGIVLFHDTNERTVRLAPEIIAALHDRGFTLVTVTQLFSGELPRSGAWRGAP